MRNHLYDFFIYVWRRGYPSVKKQLDPGDSPVHTIADDYLATCPNSVVDVLDDDTQWVDLTMVDENGNQVAIQQETPPVLIVKSEEKPIVTEVKRSKKKNRRR
jgi:hypothetical protein